MRTLRAVFLGIVVLAGSAAACSKPPRQAEVPEIKESSGEDMAAQEAAPAPAASSDTKPTAEAEDMHAKCCASCKEGLAKDRTGAKPETIPCADFTDTLSPWCLEHFRARPTMAAECK